jgi:imidazolonepropionase-like amidohydrolase
MVEKQALLMRSILAALALLLLPSSALAQTVVITADRMIDVLAGRVIERPVVMVRDGRIVGVTSGDFAVGTSADVRRIDLPGMTILPGLIDMHAHLTSSPHIRGYRRLEVTDSFWPTIGVPNARAMLEAGFTTIRNVGSANFADVGLRQGIERGLYPGPRIIAAGPSFGPTGGHCDTNDLPPSLVNRDGERGVNGAEAARLRVRQNRRYGAQVIKLCVTGGVFSANTEPGAQQMTDAEIAAAVDQAHMLGMRVAAHAHGAAGIRAAIRNGVDTIEHASLIDAEGIRLARERGTWLSMDIFNTDYTQAEGTRNGVTEDSLRRDREVAQAQRDNFRAAHRAGVRMVFGSDAGVMPHGTAAGQFRYMVEYGMTPMEAIQAATRDGAQALGRENDVGAIAVGRYADIIAVDGDPLADVRQLEGVDVVIKGGDVVSDRRQQ